MCGRYALHSHPAVIALQLGLAREPTVYPRYNIAPGQAVMLIRDNPETGKRDVDYWLWGLIPSWVKDEQNWPKPINARAETITAKPSFRSAFRHRRCLLPADGYYEWQGTKSGKAPYFIRPATYPLFGLAGIYEIRETPMGPVGTVAIIATEANDLTKPIHDRMPVIIPRSEYAWWLNPRNQNPQDLQALLTPYPSDAMIAYPVSARVNNAKNNDASLIEAVPSGSQSPPDR